jgi:hypothetical protein
MSESYTSAGRPRMAKESADGAVQMAQENPIPTLGRIVSLPSVKARSHTG